MVAMAEEEAEVEEEEEQEVVVVEYASSASRRVTLQENAQIQTQEVEEVPKVAKVEAEEEELVTSAKRRVTSPENAQMKLLETSVEINVETSVVTSVTKGTRDNEQTMETLTTDATKESRAGPLTRMPMTEDGATTNLVLKLQTSQKVADGVQQLHPNQVKVEAGVKLLRNHLQQQQHQVRGVKRIVSHNRTTKEDGEDSGQRVD